MNANESQVAEAKFPNEAHSIPWISILTVCYLLSACSTVTDVWDGAAAAAGSLFSSGGDEFADDNEQGFPDLAAVPIESPTTSTAVEREAATEGLIADRDKAQYTGQVSRRDPVSVRPLQDSNSTILSNDEPPLPSAAPVTPVTAIATAQRNRPSLAERLGASPPPPPPASADSAPPPPPLPSLASAISVPSTTARAPIAIIGGGDTESEDVAVPNEISTYDPSDYQVSTHVSTITFARGSSRLTASNRRTLDDVINLRQQYDGAVRVIGHASSRTQDLDPIQHKLVNFRVSLNRANAVAAALIAKGLPNDRIFVGAVSDNEPLFYEVMPAGESGNQRAEIYLDY
ncbi:MAG: OmpA family protein [Rhodospirillaceae bacterium]